MNIETLYSKNKKISYFRTIRRIITFTVRYAFWPTMFCLVIFIILGLLPTLTAYTWKVLLDVVNDNFITRNKSSVYMYILFYTLSLGLSVLINSLSETPDTILRNKVKKIAFKQIHEKVKAIPLVYFDNPKINDLMSNATSSMVEGKFMCFVLGLTSMIGNVFSIVFAAMLLNSYNPYLGIVLLLVLLPVVLKAWLNKKIVALKYQQIELHRKANTYSDYILEKSYLMETRLWDLSDYFLKKRNETIEIINKEEAKVKFVVNIYNLLINSFHTIVYIGCLSLGIALTVQGKTSYTIFVALLTLLESLFGRYQQLLNDLIDLRADTQEVYEGFVLFDLPEEGRNSAELNVEKAITLNHGSFHYPYIEKNLFTNINLAIHKNEIIAIVGANGSGKSTLVKLLIGLYQPLQGKVLYDNTDISKVSYESLYKDTSAAFEDYNRHNLTIAENVALSQQYDETELKNLLIQVQFQLDKFPKGLNTGLGIEFGGIDISGGEWQKLALARAYFKKSKLIVLDEPTASLDAKSEYGIYSQFKEICKNKTGIIITHRLGAARLADRIFLLEDGNLAEQGTHDELMQLDGKYKNMFLSQSELYI